MIEPTASMDGDWWIMVTRKPRVCKRRGPQPGGTPKFYSSHAKKEDAELLAQGQENEFYGYTVVPKGEYDEKRENSES